MDRLRVEMAEPDCAVVATGGIAPIIAPESKTIQSVDPNLTLKGLQILHARNTKGTAK